MAALTSQQDGLYQWLQQSLPAFLFADDTQAHEMWQAIAVALDAPLTTITTWLRMTFLTHATGAWLDLLGRERSIYRTASESDDAYRARIKNVEETVTRPALEAAGDAILAAENLTTGVRIVNLRRERAYFSTRASGQRSSYWKSASGVSYRWGRSGVDGDTSVARVANSATIVGDDPTKRRDKWHPGRFVVVIPYGATATARAAIEAVIENKKAAGFKALYQYRESP
jgi:hypothetical protein